MSNKKKSKKTTFKNRLVELRNPKSKARRIFDIALVLCVVGVIGIIVAENIHHHNLKTNAERLKSSLERRNIEVSDIQTTCFNPAEYSVFGESEGHRYCSMGMSINGVVTVADANKIIAATNAAIEETDSNNVRGKKLEPLFEAPYGSSEYGISLTSKCGIRYTYKGAKDEELTKKNALRINYSCDDTSWFGRMFL